MNIKFKILQILSTTLVVVSALAFVQPSFADRYDGRYHGGGRHYSGDVRYDGGYRQNRRGGWQRPSVDHWHRGGWRHDRYAGVAGWWWIVDGYRYFYNAPVYPYPAYAPHPYYSRHNRRY